MHRTNPDRLWASLASFYFFAKLSLYFQGYINIYFLWNLPLFALYVLPSLVRGPERTRPIVDLQKLVRKLARPATPAVVAALVATPILAIGAPWSRADCERECRSPRLERRGPGSGRSLPRSFLPPIADGSSKCAQRTTRFSATVFQS